MRLPLSPAQAAQIEPMTDTATISENFSEIPKRKRGRPRGENSHMVEFYKTMNCLPEGGTRTKSEWAFSMKFYNAIHNADADTQRAVWGCTKQQIMAGTGELPNGWKTAAASVGRYLEATDDEPAHVAGIVAKARRDGISFGDIAAHFRRLRLGDREGNAVSLTQALARALDEYRKRFPKTTDEQARAALHNVADQMRIRTQLEDIAMGHNE